MSRPFTPAFRRLMRTEVAALRGHGLTWAEIARRTGLCRETARQLHADCQPRRPLFNTVTRIEA